MQKALVNVNGEIFDSAQARAAVFDRGFLYGDSLYEVVRTYGGRPAFMAEHLERLGKSAELCRMTLSQSLDQYRREMEKTTEAFRKLPGESASEVYCRLIVTRGIGRIGFGTNCVETPSQYYVIAQKLDPPTAEQFEKGFHYQVAQRLRNDRRALDPAMKSGNYLNSLLAFIEAAGTSGRDYDDALLCNADGHLTEGTTFNIFYVNRGIVATPPLDVGILDGITRRETLRLARELGIETREVRFPKERMYEADEVFMTSTIKEVFPVTRLDGRKIAGGKPGPVTRKLARAFTEMALARVRGGGKAVA
jgi:branched-chain amino acid aminotransferase